MRVLEPDCPGVSLSCYFWPVCYRACDLNLCAYVLICRIGILIHLLSGVNNLCRFFFFFRKVFTAFVTILLLLYVFLCVACWVLAPLPGIKCALPAPEGEVLTTGAPKTSLCRLFLKNYLTGFSCSTRDLKSSLKSFSCSMQDLWLLRTL